MRTLPSMRSPRFRDERPTDSMIRRSSTFLDALRRSSTLVTISHEVTPGVAQACNVATPSDPGIWRSERIRSNGVSDAMTADSASRPLPTRTMRPKPSVSSIVAHRRLIVDDERRLCRDVECFHAHTAPIPETWCDEPSMPRPTVPSSPTALPTGRVRSRASGAR